MKKRPADYSEADARPINEKEKRTDTNKVISNEPGINVLMIFYLLPFFFLTLLLAIGFAVLPHVNVQLPPAVTNLLPWKWAILAGLNVLLLLFLALQLLLGFSLENSIRSWGKAVAEREVTTSTTPGKGRPSPTSTPRSGRFSTSRSVL